MLGHALPSSSFDFTKRIYSQRGMLDYFKHNSRQPPTNTGLFSIPFLRVILLIKSLFLLKAVIDANIFPVLIDILGKAEFKTRKEAAWAITNATSGGTAEQIRFLVNLVFFFLFLRYLSCSVSNVTYINRSSFTLGLYPSVMRTTYRNGC